MTIDDNNLVADTQATIGDAINDWLNRLATEKVESAAQGYYLLPKATLDGHVTFMRGFLEMAESFEASFETGVMGS